MGWQNRRATSRRGKLLIFAEIWLSLNLGLKPSYNLLMVIHYKITLINLLSDYFGTVSKHIDIQTLKHYYTSCMFLARFSHAIIFVRYVSRMVWYASCTIQYVSHMIRYVFQSIRYAFCTMKYISCTIIWYFFYMPSIRFVRFVRDTSLSLISNN